MSDAVLLWNAGHGMLTVGITLTLVAICGGPRRCGVAGCGVSAAGIALIAAGDGVLQYWGWMGVSIVACLIGGYLCVSSALKPPRSAP